MQFIRAVVEVAVPPRCVPKPIGEEHLPITATQRSCEREEISRSSIRQTKARPISLHRPLLPDHHLQKSLAAPLLDRFPVRREYRGIHLSALTISMWTRPSANRS